MRFLDTNILLYRISQNPGEAQKMRVASLLMKEDNLCLSIQVLQEFYVQATRPSKQDRLLHGEAVSLIESWKRFHVQATTLSLLDAALRAKDRWQLSFWDAAIIEAARLADCETVYSEDLQDGQSFEGIRVVNPFKQIAANGTKRE